MVARGAADKSVYPVNLPSPDRYVYMSGELVPETEATLSIYDTAVTTTTAPPPARPDSAWWAGAGHAGRHYHRLVAHLRA